MILVTVKQRLVQIRRVDGPVSMYNKYLPRLNFVILNAGAYRRGERDQVGSDGDNACLLL